MTKKKTRKIISWSKTLNQAEQVQIPLSCIITKANYIFQPIMAGMAMRYGLAKEVKNQQRFSRISTKVEAVHSHLTSPAINPFCISQPMEGNLAKSSG